MNGDETDLFQQREMKRDLAISAAVAAADHILCEATDGSGEELDYMTSAVALKFVEKTHMRNSTKVLARDLTKGEPPR